MQLAFGESTRGIGIAAFGSVPIAPARLTPRCAHGSFAFCALRVFLTSSDLHPDHLPKGIPTQHYHVLL